MMSYVKEAKYQNVTTYLFYLLCNIINIKIVTVKRCIYIISMLWKVYFLFDLK